MRKKENKKNVFVVIVSRTQNDVIYKYDCYGNLEHAKELAKKYNSVFSNDDVSAEVLEE